jgi:hypothetical protein
MQTWEPAVRAVLHDERAGGGGEAPHAGAAIRAGGHAEAAPRLHRHRLQTSTHVDNPVQVLAVNGVMILQSGHSHARAQNRTNLLLINAA